MAWPEDLWKRYEGMFVFGMDGSFRRKNGYIYVCTTHYQGIFAALQIIQKTE
jgi:hypothetical protein